ncbi:hypothetical protein NE236_17960 [Actinoallomurus purpureus]|uniref:hypothetical protein n=1 Tax=Actinoallomurus purpureus TaxID=478114 RepID=UPI002092C98C|nr:hypothetical protein [Actinoallomurus purpureus]MCO6006875.1 hypothetical protein [Actinoallomurus purpureus]
MLTNRDAAAPRALSSCDTKQDETGRSRQQTAANAARILAEDVGRYLRGELLVHAAQA